MAVLAFPQADRPTSPLPRTPAPRGITRAEYQRLALLRKRNPAAFDTVMHVVDEIFARQPELYDLDTEGA